MTEFSRTLLEQRRKRGKSRQFLSQFTGIDEAYIRRLETGEKCNPSPEVIVKLWIGLVADEGQFRNDPTMPYGLSELLDAAGFTAVARSQNR